MTDPDSIQGATAIYDQPGLWIAVYAAFISTGLLIHSIYRYWREWSGRLRVEVTASIMSKIHPNFRIGGTAKYLVLQVTNLGQKDRFIREPVFTSKRAIMGSSKVWPVVNKLATHTYPFKLEPGAITQIPFDVLDELKTFSETGKIKRVRIRITDTHGKTYKSAWFKV